MYFKIIASGSKGNCTIIKSHNTLILVDFGICVKRVKEALSDLNMSFSDINGVLITHDHADHYRSIKELSPKKVYSIKGNLSTLTNELEYDQSYTIGDFTFIPIKTCHDATAPCGFIIRDEHETLVYITDTGVIYDTYLSEICNPDYLIIESNHDIKMLMESNRPMILKTRIMSNYGHLCNEDSALYAVKIIGNKTKEVVLAHLSEECNSPSIALQTYNNILSSKGINTSLIRIVTASQNVPIDGGNKNEY